MNKTKLAIIFLSPLTLALLLIASANIIVLMASQGLIHNDPASLDDNRIGLVLGCPPTVSNGSPNTYFEQRMNAAAQLVKSGKVTTLVLSGATDGGAYHEPQAMLRALLKRKLNKDQLQLDDKGNRTFDSLNNIRLHHPGQAIIIVTQHAHARRALFIAQHLNIDAVAFNAQTQGFSDTLILTLRESLARVRAIIDIYLLRNTGSLAT